MLTKKEIWGYELAPRFGVKMSYTEKLIMSYTEKLIYTLNLRHKGGIR